MSDSHIMFGLLVFMVLLASIIPYIQRDLNNQPSTTYDLNGTLEDLEQIDPNQVVWTSIGVVESFFRMFFWVYDGMGVIFNTILLIVKFMFWWLVVKLVRGTG